jgi:hypothetical protein
MNYINKIIELGFATGQDKGNEAFEKLFSDTKEDNKQVDSILSRNVDNN